VSYAWLAKFPAEVRGLDTRFHALIEASAGTGKTYAIEHLVLRLLVENPDWKPEEILLLSFTEKTAAELRARIRGKLHDQFHDEKKLWDWNGPDAARIREAWLQSDDLAVHTIHGFCHAALLSDPVGNETLIRPDVVDDRVIADEALENLLRGSWAKRPEHLNRLREALRINSGDFWRDKLINLALAFQPWRGDRIEPAPDPGNQNALRTDVEEAVTHWKRALEVVNAGSLPLNAYLERLPVAKQSGNAFAKLSAIMGESMDSSAALRKALGTFYGQYKYGEEKAGKTKAYKLGFAAELDSTRGRITATLPEWILFAGHCTTLLRLAMRMQREQVLEGFRLRAEAAMELREELGLEKRRRGAISYDDMQKNLAEAIRKDSELSFKLRRRYKACIVDEFQDTDSLQWGILHALCLQTNKANPALPLFLVGDPKQAIYGFRGGDLGTYLLARGELRARAQQNPPEAQGTGLTKNFRSRPELVQALNEVFTQEEWFRAAAEIPEGGAWHLPESSEDVVFTPVLPGRADAPGGAALWVRDFRGMDNRPKAEVEREVRRWIAERIEGLVGDGSALTVKTKEDAAPRQPRYGDIAVLVRKHSEAEALEKVLRARGIPCRVRRRGGVFHGPTAEALRLLLELIPGAANPETQAKLLLLPYLRGEGSDWPLGLPAAIPPLLEEWSVLARKGRWPEFFHAVLQDSGYLERLARESDSDAERLEALARILGEAGSAPGTSARALCDRFDALRRGEGGDEGTASGNGADGAKAVTLMTLHLSKGLEFPVVFTAATGTGRKPDFYTLRNTTGFRHVIDKQDAEATAAYEQQSLEEEKRLFYVAFTRAMDRLYVPLLPEKYSGSESGPLGGFAARALTAVAAVQGQPWIQNDEEPLRTSTAARALVQHDPKPQSTGLPPRETLLQGARDAFAKRRRLDSFSGLARFAGETAMEELLEPDGTRVLREAFTEGPGLEESDEPAPKSYPPLISNQDLPAGAAAGNAIHKVLEHTVFESVLEAASPEEWLAVERRREILEEMLREEGLEAAHADAVARAVWNTLRMPLPDPAGGANFILADVSERRHELEFLFPFSQQSDFLQGFIDLVFRREGRYYLLDWKSNLLEDYGSEAVRESMRHHQYDLQSHIYSVALDLWLQKQVPDYDPAVHFGGVYYIYLRGASTERFCGHAHRPTTEELRVKYPAALEKTLGLRPDGRI
jgi:exodeoxyribonuclease V beta subunit